MHSGSDHTASGTTHAVSRRMKTPEAAVYLGLSVSTLEKDRLSGLMKIPFLKLGKTVLYDSAALDAYMACRQRFSTSESGPAERPAA
jgi:excisionase family DNA binding protein